MRYQDGSVALPVVYGETPSLFPRLRIRIDPVRLQRAFNDGCKRTIDLVGATALAVATLPAMIGVALAVKVSSPGPILIRQTRLTKDGQWFTLYKFRSMRADAEKYSGAVFAGNNDPRVTPLGRFLRKTRLDELPQLINVLRGEMSLVGPRPERPELAGELSRSINGFHRRLGAKAGLTGLAQVVQGYPDDTDGYRKKLAYDRLYISRQGIGLDLWILARTVGVVMNGSGAR